MSKDKIPFKIGMQYENWEFNLDILPDRIKGLDSYLNMDESLNSFLNVHSDRTELIFSLDILEGVILTFENRTYTFYSELKNGIFSDVWYMGELTFVNKPDYGIYSNKISHCITYKDKTVYLLYCHHKLVMPILINLI